MNLQSTQDEIDELFAQLVIICDGKSKSAIGNAVRRLLKTTDQELINTDTLKHLRKAANDFQRVQEQIGGALTSLVNSLEETADDINSRSRTLKALHDRVMEGLTPKEDARGP